ncbi:MAG: hypothetical protein R2699_09445 [Acidimicrobiales bacterium]
MTVTGGDALGDGGGVYAEGDLYLVDAAIVANAAAGYGGGVYGGYHVWMVNSTVASNTAGEAGGGLAALDLEADAGSAVENNEAPSGGKAYTFVTTLFGEVVGNHATAEGGGLVGAGVTLSPGALVAGNSSVGDGVGRVGLEGVIVDGAPGRCGAPPAGPAAGWPATVRSTSRGDPRQRGDLRRRLGT